MSRLGLAIYSCAAPEQLSAFNAAGSASGAMLDDGCLSPHATALCVHTGLTPAQLGVCDDVRPEAYTQAGTRLDAAENALEQRAAGLVEVQRCRRMETAPSAAPAPAEWSAVVVAALERPTSLCVDLNAFWRDKGVMVCRPDGSVVWEDTLAYAVGHGQVWVNLRGREPAGAVTPGAEYDEVCAALSRALATLADKHGRPLVSSVRRRAELYRGPQAHRLPDLVVTLTATAGFGDMAPGPVRAAGAAITAAAGMAWDPGRYWLRGPGIQSGAAAPILPAALTALVLTLLGITVPTACGQAPLALLNDEWRRRVETAAATLSATDEALLQQRLRDLGYIE